MWAGGNGGKQPAPREEATGDYEMEIEYFPNDDEGNYSDGGACPAAGQVLDQHDDGDEGGHVSDSHDWDFEDYVRRPTLKKKQWSAAKKTIVLETQESGENADGFDDSGEDAEEMPLGNGREYAWTERLVGVMKNTADAFMTVCPAPHPSILLTSPMLYLVRNKGWEGVRMRGGGQELAATEFGGRGMSDYSPEGWKGLKQGQYTNCELNSDGSGNACVYDSCYGTMPSATGTPS
eukprot:3765913-Rhodomonas_salina.1